MFEDLCETYNSSPLGKENPITVSDIAAKVKGMNTDHAADQKKLASMLCEWKITCDRDERAARALSDGIAVVEFEALLKEELTHMVSNTGGARSWEVAPEVDHIRLSEDARQRATRRFGDARFAALSDAEKCRIDLFVWGGCCMHKELNSVKGGNTRMAAFWAQADLTAPLLLMNVHNAAAASLGPSAASP